MLRWLSESRKDCRRRTLVPRPNRNRRHLVERLENRFMLAAAVSMDFTATADYRPEITVDNEQFGFRTVRGTWPTSTGDGNTFGPNGRYSPPNTGSVSRFTFQVDQPGLFDVQGYWEPHPNRATNTPFVIYHAGGVTTVPVNQETSGSSDGSLWNSIGSFYFSAGSAHIEIHSNGANEFVVADAMKLVPPDPVVIVDNDSVGFDVIAGNWRTSAGDGNTYGQNSAYSRPNSGAVSRFTLEVAQAGIFEVQGYWEPHQNRATNTPFVVYHANGIATVPVNQETSGASDGSLWNSIGSFYFPAGAAQVEIHSDGANEYVVADAIRLTPVPADVKTDSTNVAPINWGNFQDLKVTSSAVSRSAQILMNANRFALNGWWTLKGFDRQGAKPHLDLGGTGEYQIRPASEQAYALAVSIATSAYDPSATGSPLDEAIAKATKLITSVAVAHRVNTDGGWGGGWQTALWTNYAATAGWLMWEHLSREDQGSVQRMLEYEADRLIDFVVPYYRNQAGKTTHSLGDSKAEENAWNAMGLATAITMMPDHPNGNRWTAKYFELTLSALASPDDLGSEKVVNGIRLSATLAGSNLESNGMVVNHGYANSDYVVAAISQNALMPALAFTLAGKSVPRSALHNADLAYAALVDFDFGDGNTIYVDDSPEIYYPYGSDRNSPLAHYVLADVGASLLAYDANLDQRGSYWEDLHAAELLRMQKRHSDGHTYAFGEDTYSEAESWVSFHAAAAVLSKYVAQNGGVTISDNMIFASDSGPRSQITIDNDGLGFEAISGSWLASAGTGGTFGPSAAFSQPDSGAVSRFTFEITQAGLFQVMAHWVPHENRATNTPVCHP